MTKNQNIGKLGEEIALVYLKNNAYKIIAVNFRLGHKEIDIIAKKSDITVLFEVKTASNYADLRPEDYVNAQKIKNLKQAMVAYSIQEKIKLTNLNTELLAVSLDFNSKMAKIKHFKNIF